MIKSRARLVGIRARDGEYSACHPEEPTIRYYARDLDLVNGQTGEVISHCYDRPVTISLSGFGEEVDSLITFYVYDEHEDFVKQECIFSGLYRYKKETQQRILKHRILMSKIEKTLRLAFPRDTVDVSSSNIKDNIHIVVMSREFDDKTEQERLEYFWDIIDDPKHGLNLTVEEKQLISLIMVLSPQDVK